MAGPLTRVLAADALREARPPLCPVLLEHLRVMLEGLGVEGAARVQVDERRVRVEVSGCELTGPRRADGLRRVECLADSWELLDGDSIGLAIELDRREGRFGQELTAR